MNTLYYGDNLKILRDYIKDESVDLVYLDPPFNSNRNYNVLFRNESGTDSESQITAFEDTWHWNLAAELVYNELINEPDDVGQMIQAFRQFIPQKSQMMAYLVMMAVRLKELHRVLKPTGSLYLHCDPTASHYLKILLDTIFGASNFRTDVSWKRSSAHNDAKQGRMQPGNIRDTIFFYTKSDAWTWNWQYTPYSEDYVESFYNHVDSDGRRYRLGDLTAAKGGGDTSYEFHGTRPYKGRFWAYSRENMEKYLAEGRLYFPKNGGTPSYKRYLDEMPGVPLQNIWDDIRPVPSNETLGYPTQKPVALLERIVAASSNEGDVVLDPFCGCGTTIAAAQKLNREWIGIDVTHLAVGLQKLRLKDSFNMVPIKGGNPTGRAGVPAASSLTATGQEDTLPTGRVSASDAAVASYQVIGQPEDLDGAKELAEKDKYGFQWWILPLIGARAFGAEAGRKEGKKGADKGIDGLMVFTDDNSGKAKKVVVSVKGGHNVSVAQIRDLGHVIERDNAAIGVFLTLEPPTKPMLTEAAEKGFYHSPGWNKDYPRLQILTVEDLLSGKTVDLPPNLQTFKQVGRIDADTIDQRKFSFE